MNNPDQTSSNSTSSVSDDDDGPVSQTDSNEELEIIVETLLPPLILEQLKYDPTPEKKII